MTIFVIVLVYLLVGVMATYAYYNRMYVEKKKEYKAKGLLWFFGPIFWPIVAVLYWIDLFKGRG